MWWSETRSGCCMIGEGGERVEGEEDGEEEGDEWRRRMRGHDRVTD